MKTWQWKSYIVEIEIVYSSCKGIDVSSEDVELDYIQLRLVMNVFLVIEITFQIDAPLHRIVSSDL